MTRSLRQPWVFLLIFACANAQADDSKEARQWLERMDMAMRQLTYQGTFVYLRDNQVETMRITHLSDDEGMRERLYSTSGPRRELIRNSEGVRCVLDDEGSVMQDLIVGNSYFPALPFNKLGSSDTYRFETGGAANIAGHTAVRVSILPRDAYRYGYEFWLEKHTGLLLKWVLYDAQKQFLAKLLFTELKLGSEVDPDEIISPTPDDQFTRLETVLPTSQVRTNSVPKWQPSKLPPGFRLEAYNRQSPESDKVFEHLVYSDGLAAVSVYIENRDPAKNHPRGFSRVGTANAYSRNMGAMQITVIGEVPAETVRKIGNAVTLTSD